VTPPPGLGLFCSPESRDTASARPAGAGGIESCANRASVRPRGRRLETCVECKPFWDELVSGNSSSSRPTKATRQPPVARSTYFLELFSGCGRLSDAMNNAGINTLPGLEIKKGGWCDLSRRSTQLVILQWIRERRIFYVHMGTPCTVWSIARRGVKDLAKAERKEALGVNFALFSAEVAREATRAGVLWSIENPKSSRLWEFGPIAGLASLVGTRFVHFTMCAFGERCKKPTSILTNAELDSLGLWCSGGHAHDDLSGQVKVFLPGGRSEWRSKTEIAGAYPRRLCNAWARAVLKCTPSDGSAMGAPPGEDVRFTDELKSAAKRFCNGSDAPSDQFCRRAKRVEAHQAHSADPRGAAYLRSHAVKFGGSRGTQGKPAGDQKTG